MKKRFHYASLLAAAAFTAGLGGCGGSSSVTNVSLGGNITGLTTGSLVLANGTSTVTIAANMTSFTFPVRVNFSVPYVVTVQSEPEELSCSVTNDAGVAGTADITNVQVQCVANNTLSGTVSGLTSGTVVLANGSDTVSVTAPNSTFKFPHRVADGAPYGVTVLTQPQSSQTCTVINGTGHMTSVDVTSVQVNCL